MISGLSSLSGLSSIYGIGQGDETGAASFVATWKTDNTSTGSSNTVQVTLPLVNGGSYNFVADWGDGTQSVITSYNQAEVTHTYASSGTYTIKLTGLLYRFAFINTGDRLKILNVSQWGGIIFGPDTGIFYGCSNLTSNATDAPTLGTTMSGFFRSCTLFNGSIGNWNTSGVVNMSNMFLAASAFNADISSWNTSSVTTMASMFSNAVAFNQPIGSWNTSAVTSMALMFNSATAFNQSLSLWNVSSVNTMNSMFRLAVAFNQPIGSWNTSAVTNMGSMFDGATIFNQSIGSWNTAAVTITSFMFRNDTSFDQNIGTWNITSLTDAKSMFSGSNALSTSNYNSLLIGWEAQVEKPSVTFHAGDAQYSAGAAATARGALVTNGWTITDGGLAP